MNIPFPPAFFVTGTDTGIGKTVASAMLSKGLNATYWKPVQSGLQEETDTQCVRRIAGLPEEQIIPERFRLTEPLSPHASASIDGIQISLHDFNLPEFNTKHLVVEGAGGLMVPLNDTDMMIDLIRHLNVPVLLVASSELGTLNHTFLSLEALRKRDIPIMGVLLNGPKNESNRTAIEKYGQINVIGEIENIPNLTPAGLEKTFNTIFAS